MKRSKTTKLAISLLTIVVAVGLVSMGTFAYFSDSASSEDNEFSSGNIDVKVSNDGTTWSDGTSGTWTMDNMKPGDVVDANLYVKNTGSIDVVGLLSKISLTGDLASCTPNVTCGLADMIDMLEYNDDTSVGSGALFVTYFAVTKGFDTGGPEDPNTPDGRLTLAEWHAADRAEFPGYDTAWYCGGSGPHPENPPCLLADGVATNRGGSEYFFLHIKWRMNPDADNDYQGLSATYSLKVNGQQTWPLSSETLPGWPAEDV
ncbi:MAG: TasA family protein [Thermoleophilia bacterium]